MLQPFRSLVSHAHYLDILMVMLCSLTLLHGVRTTYGLQWPGEADLYRDIAHAQTIADGDWKQLVRMQQGARHGKVLALAQRSGRCKPKRFPVSSKWFACSMATGG